MALDDASRRYLASQGHGRLATVGPGGRPENKPVGFHYNAELGTIDISGIDMEASAKYRNVGARPDVAFVVDDIVAEGAAGMRFVEIRGGPSSRYETVRVLAPAPDVAVAHVRRVALDPAGRPLEPTAETTGPFSEMALYVLVRRNGTWWLAAGQNTPVRPAPN
jgi:pyridoxamine 5'-phosphate oxidase family protein